MPAQQWRAALRSRKRIAARTLFRNLTRHLAGLGPTGGGDSHLAASVGRGNTRHSVAGPGKQPTSVALGKGASTGTSVCVGSAGRDLFGGLDGAVQRAWPLAFQRRERLAEGSAFSTRSRRCSAVVQRTSVREGGAGDTAKRLIASPLFRQRGRGGQRRPVGAILWSVRVLRHRERSEVDRTARGQRPR